MEGVLTQLFDVIIGIIAIVASGFATWGIKKLMTKVGMDVTEKKEKVIRQATQNAILFAEEWAAKKIKLKEKIEVGESKMNIAFKNLVKKVPGITVAEATELIEEELPKLGLGASKFIETMVKKAMEE